MRRAAIAVPALFGATACVALLRIDEVGYVSGDAGLDAAQGGDAGADIEGGVEAGCSTVGRFCDSYDGGGRCVDFEDDVDASGFAVDVLGAGALTLEPCEIGCCAVMRLPLNAGAGARAQLRSSVTGTAGTRVRFMMLGRNMPFKSALDVVLVDVESGGFHGELAARSVGLIASVGSSSETTWTPIPTYADGTWTEYDIEVIRAPDAGAGSLQLLSPLDASITEPAAATARPPPILAIHVGPNVSLGSLPNALEIRIDNLIVEPR